MSTRTDGWPATTGPLVTLQRIGLVKDARRRPAWLSFPKTEDHGEFIAYKASCKFMNKEGLRALAALTLEGWDVHVNPANGEFDIKITATNV